MLFYQPGEDIDEVRRSEFTLPENLIFFRHRHNPVPHKSLHQEEWSVDVSQVFLRRTRREASNDYIARNLELFRQNRRKKRKRRVGIWGSVDSAVAGHGELGTPNGGARASDANLKRHGYLCVPFRRPLNVLNRVDLHSPK